MIAPWIRASMVAVLAATLSTTTGCGGKKKSDADEEEPSDEADHKKKKKPVEDDEDWDLGTTSGAKKPAGKQLVPEIMGLTRPSVLSYKWGRGSAEYRRAEKAQKKKDWAAVQKHCEAAVARNGDHLHARYLLALALAEQGKTTGLAAHLSRALAADWLAWGPKLAKDPAFKKYLEGAEGLGVVHLNAAYRQSFTEKARKGILVVGRRSKYTPPKKPGRQWSSPRGEVLAYDRETKRYLRLTHTSASVAGFVLSSSGSELAFLSYNYVDWPKRADDPVLIGMVAVGVINLETMEPAFEKPARVRGYFRRVELEYGAGDELVISTYQADGRKRLATPLTYTLDKGRGMVRKRRETAGRKDGYLAVMWEQAFLSRGPVPGVQSSFPSRTVTLAASKKEVSLLEDEQVGADGMTWSPDKAHLTLRTLADPCANKKMSSLYVVSAADGKLTHLLRGNSTWDSRWLDNDTLVYQDPAGGIRIHDIAARKQLDRLYSYGGLGLNGIGAEIGPACIAVDGNGGDQTGGDQTGGDEDAPEPEVMTGDGEE